MDNVIQFQSIPPDWFGTVDVEQAMRHARENFPGIFQRDGIH